MKKREEEWLIRFLQRTPWLVRAATESERGLAWLIQVLRSRSAWDGPGHISEADARAAVLRYVENLDVVTRLGLIAS